MSCYIELQVSFMCRGTCEVISSFCFNSVTLELNYRIAEELVKGYWNAGGAL